VKEIEYLGHGQLDETLKMNNQKDEVNTVLEEN